MKKLIAVKILLALLLFSPLVENAAAQQKAGTRQPVTVGGFGYNYVKRGRVHINKCQVNNCQAGSVVTYQIFRPEKNPKFSNFVIQQKALGASLKDNPETKTTFKIGVPREADVKDMKIFNNYYAEYNDGKLKTLTRTTFIYTPKASFSMISSGNSRAIIDQNGNAFASRLIALANGTN